MNCPDTDTNTDYYAGITLAGTDFINVATVSYNSHKIPNNTPLGIPGRALN